MVRFPPRGEKRLRDPSNRGHLPGLISPCRVAFLAKKQDQLQSETTRLESCAVGPFCRRGLLTFSRVRFAHTIRPQNNPNSESETNSRGGRLGHHRRFGCSCSIGWDSELLAISLGCMCRSGPFLERAIRSRSGSHGGGRHQRRTRKGMNILEIVVPRSTPRRVWPKADG